MRLSHADAEHLALVATRAPSIHNTQPWQLVVTRQGIDVHADWSRRLAVLDPLGRQLLISCGAVVNHLVVAARALGLEADVRLLPSLHANDLVASIDLTGRPSAPRAEDVTLAEAALHRATSRHRFEESRVEAECIEALRQVVSAHGAALAEVHDDQRILLDVVAQHAEQELLTDDRYRQELADWVFDPDQDGERPDGLPVAAVLETEARAEDVPGRQFLPGAGLHGGPAEHPTLLLLTTPSDRASSWVHVGMALSALLLEATRLGLAAQVIGQATDIAYERARLRHDLGLVGVPQLVLRVGRPTERVPLQTPRRAPEDVLSWADGDGGV